MNPNLPLHGCYDCQDPDVCERLRRRIDELINRNKHSDPPSQVLNGDVHGLRYRFAEQINGRDGPGTQSWIEHDEQIRGQQEKLQRELEEYERNGCGPPPPGAWSWATRPRPSEGDYRGSNPINDRPADEGLTTGETVAVAAGGTALAYLGYRALRMLPSLLFPPSIPVNLAIP